MIPRRPSVSAFTFEAAFGFLFSFLASVLTGEPGVVGLDGEAEFTAEAALEADGAVLAMMLIKIQTCSGGGLVCGHFTEGCELFDG